MNVQVNVSETVLKLGVAEDELEERRINLHVPAGLGQSSLFTELCLLVDLPSFSTQAVLVFDGFRRGLLRWRACISMRGRPIQFMYFGLDEGLRNDKRRR